MFPPSDEEAIIICIYIYKYIMYIHIIYSVCVCICNLEDMSRMEIPVLELTAYR